ncbi:hypothetical protein QO010_001772 [Caulobacter ginsengisoli]|uniref:Acyltransferase 3 domain-containing protein n=1 Tax=Caulobacter ginsengisoli TaxID=400775 RepID=A0ABU0IPR2_9CAUL|nr:acyltransferase family protein [Caulobacter ginsengisoli]MDQ0464001.1 hypothetical protein [Caulobacter ginsengisoli]
MPSRRYFLDWMRVIAFALLAVFHVGMLYVTWRYNLKSPRIFPDLEWAMLALTPWRMALLFVISGVACRFLIEKLGPGRFTLDRLARLQPVILTGMFLVIPAQTYVELVDKGLVHTGYLDFWWSSYLRADQTLVAPLHKTMPTWDHLWFLVYLQAYVLGFAALFKLFGRRGGRALPLAVLLIAPALWLAATNLIVDTVAPRTDGFVDDWGCHLRWIGLFAAGAALAFRDDAWAFLEKRRATLGLGALALLALQFAVHALASVPGIDPLAQKIGWNLASGLYGWTTILALAGYAAHYLNRGSAVLTYLNQAILPVYVLHQPVMLVSAFWLFPLRLPLGLEVGLLIAAASLGSLVLYHLAIRPFAATRLLFGVKNTQPGTPPPALTAQQSCSSPGGRT